MVLLPVQAQAQDIAVQDMFIGMVVPDGDGLVLERCSIGKPRYRLRAAERAGDPFAVLQGMGDKVQAQVIARYRADGEVHILEVTSIEDIKPGKSCHLLDVFDESLSMAEAGAAEAGTEAKIGAGACANADKDHWEGLAAGATVIQLRVSDDIGESLPSSCADGTSEEGEQVVLPTASGKGME